MLFKIARKRLFNMSLCVLIIAPEIVLAGQMDPVTTSAKEMKNILFGGLGLSLCAISIGATFLMAKAGKVSWDRFVSVGLYTAGFLGAPSIVIMIKNMVG